MKKGMKNGISYVIDFLSPPLYYNRRHPLLTSIKQHRFDWGQEGVAAVEVLMWAGVREEKKGRGVDVNYGYW